MKRKPLPKSRRHSAPCLPHCVIRDTPDDHRPQLFEGVWLSCKHRFNGFAAVDSVFFAGGEVCHCIGMILSIFSGTKLSADLHAGLFHPECPLRAVVGDRDSEVSHPGKAGLSVFRIFKSVYDEHLKNQTYRRVYRFAFISKLSLTLFMFFNKSGHNGILFCQGFVQKGVKLLCMPHIRRCP